MQITNVIIQPLNLVPNIPLTVAYNSYPVFEYAIIKVITENGIAGLGEASPDPEVTGETQEIVLEALEKAKHYLIGKSFFAIGRIITELEELIPESPAARAAVDMALYDLVGKMLKTPVYNLLGGQYRKSISLYPVISMDKPEVMAKSVCEFIEIGFIVFKLKVGSDPDHDVERVAKIRELCGDSPILRLDVNQGWNDAATSIKAIQKLKKYSIDLIEQPVKAGDIDGLAEVKRSVKIPIMVDEGCHSPADALQIIQKNAADIINIKLMKCGGIYRALDIISIAEAAKIPCIIGSMGESSIASSAGLHVVVSKKIINACEIIGPLFIKNDPAEGFDADLKKGRVSVSDRFGLGVKMK